MKLFTALHMNFTELRNNIDNPNGKKKKVEKPFGIWYHVKGVRNHE